VNICQACDYVAPARDSMGAERVVERVTRALVAAGHTVTMVLNPSTKACPVPGALLAFQPPADADIVHYHGWDPLRYDQAGLPWVTTIHGYSLHQHPELAQGSKHVVAVSGFAARQFGAIQYVWNCADPEEFPFQPQKDDYFVWMAGTDWGEGKGLFSTIMLAKRLKFKLKIAGSGQRQDIIQQIQSLCDQRIEYLGSVNGSSKAELLGRAKALVLLTKLPDACPVSVSEALMSGTPVIGSVNGSMPEIVLNGITGYTCSNDSQVIRAVLNIDKIDPKACRDYAMRFFSPAECAKKYLNIYSRVLN
jgi:glycosyltransferase involved in cell wall biosynthesis